MTLTAIFRDCYSGVMLIDSASAAVHKICYRIRVNTGVLISP